jgi:hypothetical protein
MGKDTKASKKSTKNDKEEKEDKNTAFSDSLVSLEKKICELNKSVTDLGSSVSKEFQKNMEAVVNIREMFEETLIANIGKKTRSSGKDTKDEKQQIKILPINMWFITSFEKNEEFRKKYLNDEIKQLISAKESEIKKKPELRFRTEGNIAYRYLTSNKKSDDYSNLRREHEIYKDSVTK